MLMALEIFFCYAHEDEALLNKLKGHLTPLYRQGLIDVWYDHDISAGTEWEREIDKHLNTAQIILLLISPDFMNSDYCYGKEMQRAMERQGAGETRIIPVILRPTDWKSAPFGQLEALPKDGKAVVLWRPRDGAFLDIARGVRNIVEGQYPLRTETILHRNIPPCPYRGLSAFREQDAPFFFGRTTFTEQLVEDVRQKPLSAVIGPSGSGKSSVVFAGLLTQLRLERNWLIVSFRPGNQPFRALAATLIPLLEPMMSEIDRLVEINKLAVRLQDEELLLYDVLIHILEKHSVAHLLLITDQFEEIYTVCREAEQRKRFIDQFLVAVQTQPSYHPQSIHLLITLRADFVGYALSSRRFADA